MNEIDRQPLMSTWDLGSTSVHNYVDHDAARFERLSPEAVLAFVVASHVKRPTVWQPRFYREVKPGVFLCIGHINRNGGVHSLHLWPETIGVDTGHLSFYRIRDLNLALELGRANVRVLLP